MVETRGAENVGDKGSIKNNTHVCECVSINSYSAKYSSSEIGGVLLFLSLPRPSIEHSTVNGSIVCVFD